MNQGIARAEPIELAALPSRIAGEIIVGKDVLELLAGAMYADPLTVYREYVQNAADAIDEVRSCGGSLPPGPHVTIALDHNERTVRIRDHGAGVRADEFIRRLTAVGASAKRGKTLRGFRGVGRLSGLGYCQELIFRGRARGEDTVGELRWDNRLLRERLRDPSFTGTLTDLIREIATVGQAPVGTAFPEHFFEVEMRKVVRIKNDVLMNEEEIRSYLSQVAPVPFAPDFCLGQTIRSWLRKCGVGEPIHIEVLDGRGPVYHRAVNEIAIPKIGVARFQDVEFLELENSAGELLAVGWLLDHNYIGAMPRTSQLGGLRIRIRDVQIGDSQTLAPLFPEPRFAGWTVGDVHVLHSKIVPNGRRDDFEHSRAYGELQDELRVITKRIGALIRTKSDQRRRDRRIRLALTYAAGWLDIVKQRKLHETVRRVALERTEAQLKIVDKESTKAGIPEAVRVEATRLEQLTKRFRATLDSKKAPGRPPIGRSKGAYAAVSAILSSTTLIRKAVPMAERVIAAMEETVTEKTS